MEQILRKLAKYQKDLLKSITIIVPFVDKPHNIDKINISKINELHDNQYITTIEYLLIIQSCKASITKKVIEHINLNGFLNIKSVIKILKAIKRYKYLSDLTSAISTNNYPSYRVFEILNDHYLTELITISYKLIDEKTGIKDATSSLLQDIIRSNTRQSYENKHIQINENKQERLLEIIINSFLKLKPTESTKLLIAANNTTIFWLTKYISNILTKILAKFVADVWLPSKLSIDDKTDKIIYFKTQITELIYYQDIYNININYELLEDFLNTLKNQDLKIDKSSTTIEVNNLKTFYHLQKYILEQKKTKPDYLLKKLKEHEDIIEYLTYKISEHIKSASINSLNHNHLIDHNDITIIDLINHFSSIPDANDDYQLKETIYQSSIKSSNDVISDLKQLLYMLKKSTDKTINKDTLEQISTVYLSSSNIVLNFLTTYISQLTKSLIYRNIDLATLNVPGEQYNFYTYILKEHSKKTAELLDTLNYQGLALLSAKNNNNNYIESRFAILKHIKHLVGYGTKYSNPNSLKLKQKLVNLNIKHLSEIKTILDNKNKTINIDELNIRYCRLEKTARLLEENIKRLKDDIRGAPNKTTIDRQKKPIDKITYFLKLITSKLFLNINIILLTPISISYVIIKNINYSIKLVINTLFKKAPSPLQATQGITTIKKQLQNTVKKKAEQDKIIIKQDSNKDKDQITALLPTVDLNSYIMSTNIEDKLNEDLKLYLGKCYKLAVSKAENALFEINKLKLSVICYSPAINIKQRQEYRDTCNQIINNLNKVAQKTYSNLKQIQSKIHSTTITETLISERFELKHTIFLLNTIINCCYKIKSKTNNITIIELKNIYINFTRDIAAIDPMHAHVLRISKQLIIDLFKHAVRGDKAAITFIVSGIAGASTYTTASIISLIASTCTFSVSIGKQKVNKAISWLRNTSSQESMENEPGEQIGCPSHVKLTKL